MVTSAELAQTCGQRRTTTPLALRAPSVRADPAPCTLFD